jgi:hypothetical protein
MYAETRPKTAATQLLSRPRNAAVVVPFRKLNTPADYRKREQEPETLMAAVSLGAVLLMLLTSLAMKLWMG